MSTGDANPILTSDLSLEKRTLWFGTIALYEDHVSISGWRWSGPFRRDIPIGDLRLVERFTTRRGPNVVLHVRNGMSFKCRIHGGAWYWERAFREDDRISLKMRH